jgi:membrane protein YdbS with pleckstrin-like domain
MSWRNFVLRACRVPHDPAPPPGSPPRVFRAARNYFTLRVITWVIAQLFGIIGLIVAVSGLAFAKLPQPARNVFTVIEIIGLITFATQFFYSLAVLRLDYELRWYMVSDRAIRIREGILTVREKTIALANIQNIAIRQGPLQRLLGIADVEVKTAGGGDVGADHGRKSLAQPMHIAYFRGVDNANEIRDLVREGVRRQRSTGLGDPDERHERDDLHAAVATLLDEARKLSALSSQL